MQPNLPVIQPLPKDWRRAPWLLTPGTDPRVAAGYERIVDRLRVVVSDQADGSRAVVVGRERGLPEPTPADLATVRRVFLGQDELVAGPEVAKRNPLALLLRRLPRQPERKSSVGYARPSPPADEAYKGGDEDVGSGR